MMLQDVIGIGEGAKLLGLASDSLRPAAQSGTLNARKVGGSWITTRQDVERYRADHLGRVGRKPGLR